MGNAENARLSLLARRLWLARERRGVPQEWVALQIGKTIWTIRAYERGDRIPPATILAVRIGSWASHSRSQIGRQ
jgi:DNA-binding XRE family transcriptional regulator